METETDSSIEKINKINETDESGKVKSEIKSDPEYAKSGFSGILWRFALILFIGVSVYFFVSTIVLISLTKSEKEVVVPGIVGKSFIEVYNSLVRKGLKPEIKFYNVYDIDGGIILNQHPEAGTVVPEGGDLKLVVSRGKVYIPVPNLVGAKLPFAINKLKSLHMNNMSYSLSTGVISYISSDVSDNTVIDHSPGPGEEVSPDKRINLLVSAGNIKPEMKMPGVNGQYIDLCFDLFLARGLSVYEEVVHTETKWKSGLIQSQKPAHGAALKKGNSVRVKVLHYPFKEHSYISYERVGYTIPADRKQGIYEAYIEDSRLKRIRFRRRMKPGRKIDFVFKRTGNARISIVHDREVVEVITINVDEFD